VHQLPYIVNCSIIYPDLPVLERAAAAAAAGFGAVEFWWPFPTAAPEQAEVDAFVGSIEAAGVRLVALNFFGGDMGRGDRGVLSLPGREAEFRSSVQVAAGIAERLGTRLFNALYGNRVDGADPASQDRIAVDNLLFAVATLEEVGGTVLLESVSGADRYPLRTAADAAAVIDRTGVHDGRIAILADLYHLAVNGEDVEAVIGTYVDRIAHVQIADAPGRQEPGTGRLPLDSWLSALEKAGYQGFVSLEYRPSSPDAAFAWLPHDRRTAAAT
jgi:hydroxypyruvate isomerase